jgi:hypothetical protein
MVQQPKPISETLMSVVPMVWYRNVLPLGGGGFQPPARDPRARTSRSKARRLKASATSVHHSAGTHRPRLQARSSATFSAIVTLKGGEVSST